MYRDLLKTFILLSSSCSLPLHYHHKYHYSGSSENSYPTQTDNSNSTTPHQNGFLSRSPQKIQTEPVDFSGNQPVDFSGPRMGFGIIGPTPYSRESTPDSGGSHYIDNFRDPSGKLTAAVAYCYSIQFQDSHV